ncbi:hypothetical protein GRAN_0746 [Granulicella sibirica]|uniref:DinB-like domain-containing protein n=2 Tax=Granulicella sibirica TaxID=2479048 RepID=A0A4Q0T705_9BACT|nr:hypothetical protein GRAN_0746 [Granulicella sibirica]
MMGVAQAMPAEKYSFAPSQAIFTGSQTTKYEGVRTFGQMIAHIAQANYGIFRAVGGVQTTVDTKTIASLTSKDDLVAALKASFDYAHQSVARLTLENAFEMVLGTNSQTRATMAGYGVMHGFDHYGQLVEYLRMNGIVPPASQKM